jgi:hypothetical protein
MKTRRAIVKDAADHDGRFHTDANYGTACPRSNFYAKMTYPFDGQQDISQPGQIVRLVCAMAALSLENSRIEERIEEEFEVLDLRSMVTRPRHAEGLEDGYVIVDHDCVRASAASYSDKSGPMGYSRGS